MVSAERGRTPAGCIKRDCPRLYRRTVGRHLHSDSKRTRVEKIMVLLVESGVLYFFFFVSRSDGVPAA